MSDLPKDYFERYSDGYKEGFADASRRSSDVFFCAILEALKGQKMESGTIARIMQDMNLLVEEIDRDDDRISALLQECRRLLGGENGKRKGDISGSEGS